jgi:hypothetical protein
MLMPVASSRGEAAKVGLGQVPMALPCRVMAAPARRSSVHREDECF